MTGVQTCALPISLHLQGRVRLPRAFETEKEFAVGRPKPFSYWSKVRVATYRDAAIFEIEYGTVTLRLTFAVPGEFRLWHASTPDTPPHRRESVLLETFGSAATFTTTFEPKP